MSKREDDHTCSRVAELRYVRSMSLYKQENKANNKHMLISNMTTKSQGTRTDKTKNIGL